MRQCCQRFINDQTTNFLGLLHPSPEKLHMISLNLKGGRWYLAVNYTGTKSLWIFLLALKTLDTFIVFWLVVSKLDVSKPFNQ